MASTIFGIPLTWGVVFVGELIAGFTIFQIPGLKNAKWDGPVPQAVMTILTAAWIAPSDETGTWAVPLAALVLLVPFFIVSVWWERVIMEHMLPTTNADAPQDGEVPEKTLRRAVREANLASYAGLFAITCAWLAWEILHK